LRMSGEPYFDTHCAWVAEFIDRLGRDRQPGGDLPVGEVEAGQCGHLLLSGGERLPVGQVRFRYLTIQQGIIKQILCDLLARKPGFGGDLL